MNLILLDDADFVGDSTVRLTDPRRTKHIRSVHRAQEGDQLTVGRLGGQIGRGTVTQISAGLVALDVVLDQPPPPRAPVLLLLALPRPKALRRILQHLATLGVDQIVLLNAYRVEKSFWSSPLLEDDAIEGAMRLGLEQARDTVLPRVQKARLFKPFVQDTMPGLAAGRRCLLAHPHTQAPCPRGVAGPMALAVGPEGGWIDYERGLLEDAGFEAVTLGPRVLRTESALSVLLGRLV